MALVDRLLLFVVRALLRLRYRVRVIGLDAVLARGKRGIVFFPNHPALIDPIIVMATLFPHFRPRALADKDQIDRFFVRWMARRVGIVPLPDIRKYGPQAKAEVEARVHEVYESLQRDSNMLMYPSGHLYRSRYEDLRGNSGVETILREVPGVRVVLIRTRGLWGSRFGMASGQIPHVGKVLRQGLLEIVASCVFFTPRREVTLELHEPADLPRTADRNTLNAHLERFYNDNAPSATLVPRTIWDRGGVREIPDPPVARAEGALSEIPASVRSVVAAQLEAMAEQGPLRDEQRLAQDLGLDSLDRAELALWLGREFGFHVTDVDAIQTVGDVMLAARGQAVVSKNVALKPVPEAWQIASDPERVEPPAGETIADAFLHAARRRPGAVAIADQIRGAMTYRDLVTAGMVLRPVLAKLPGERMGLMLPASVASCVAYLSIVFAGKTPVMVNWTAGARNILHGLDLAVVERIITSKALVGRLRGQGLDVASFESRFVYLEDVGASLGRWDKLRAALLARVSWASLARVKASPHAAILFTSGSESLPKAVPLSHQNILSNLRDILRVIHVRRDDALIGFLPPFHSFGLTVTMLLPLVVGVRAAYHANPTEAWVIAQPRDAACVDSHGGDRRREVPRADVPDAARTLPGCRRARRLRHHRMLADRLGQRPRRPPGHDRPRAAVARIRARRSRHAAGDRAARPPRRGIAGGHAAGPRAERIRRLPGRRADAVRRVRRPRLVSHRRPRHAGRRRNPHIPRAVEAIREARRRDDLAAGDRRRVRVGVFARCGRRAGRRDRSFAERRIAGDRPVHDARDRPRGGEPADSRSGPVGAAQRVARAAAGGDPCSRHGQDGLSGAAGDAGGE
ncbi:MAG: AMP-binding protein [Planctomycetes bacterium]|nr:AMP-binding protein [Planctomycetota bacterium]